MTMNVVVVSYAFPPVGGAGVQRMLKLVKYLPEHGVRPTVLTVSRASVPLTDTSLLAEIPPDVTVLRAPTLEPEYGAKQLAWRATGTTSESLRTRIVRRAANLGRWLMVPDPQILWLPAAAHALLGHLRREPESVVLISGPPFSQFLLGLLAKEFASVPVVLDYRDEWTTTSSVYEMARGGSSDRLLEAAVLRRADGVVTATEDFRERLLARFDFLHPERVVSIPNGYDPADFVGQPPAPPTDRMVISYVGTVFRLTSARGFLRGLRLFKERSPELGKLCDVRFVGRIVETEADAFADTEPLGVTREGYVDHAKAIQALAASHVALCLLDAVDGAEGIYPAKIFEIMRLGRRCLAVTPEGALARLVRRHRAGEVVAPGDTEAIATALQRLVTEFRSGTLLEWGGPVDFEIFDRRRQAGAFARALTMAESVAHGERRHAGAICHGAVP